MRTVRPFSRPIPLLRPVAAPRYLQPRVRNRLLTGALWVSLSVLPQVAQSGPLWDRLQERRAMKEQAQGPEQVVQDPYGASAKVALTKGKVLHDLAYGTDAKQRLDVYMPASAKVGSPVAPVILMVHGGAWRIGDKRHSQVVENKVTRWVGKGFVLVSINNRLLPQTDPLQQAHDVARALAYVQTHAPSWGGNPQSVVLMGHSAGAHLVALLAAYPRLAQDLGATPWLGTVALDSAAMDVTRIMQVKHMGLYDPAFGTDPAYWASVSPTQLLTAHSLPILAVCSSERADSCVQARALAQRGAQVGSRVQVLPQALSHIEINAQLGVPGVYTTAVEQFMASLSPELAQWLAAP
ncbi:alpha/beta hydrolase [Rhodoferax aquaticus]|uniref:Alpha/beta hydrolase n=1 Tax=Rhodoferax aquaticus TaxID=2527691 RepID=A0A515ET49_9BURK|nr:alpha/beta hydrolase [Rhodoferax aquaticus]QDL55831.1 alpha/beta hydrolase [Rhodoferax aquaticus]